MFGLQRNLTAINSRRQSSKPRRKTAPAWRRALLLEQLERREVFALDVAASLCPVSDTAASLASASADPVWAADTAAQTPAIDLVALAQALTDAGAKFFGAGWCPHCTAQKESFGDGQRYLPFIEVTNPDHTLNQVGIDNNIATFPTWVFPDGSKPLTGNTAIATLAERSGVAIPTGVAPSIFPIADVTVQAGSPLWVALDGYDPNGDPLTYTVESGNAGLVAASIPEGNRSLRVKVKNFGEMNFQLFDDLVPALTDQIADLASSGAYNNTVANPQTFARVTRTAALTAIESSLPTGSAATIDDQFHADLQFNQAGLISLAESGGDDSSSGQFFVTGAAARQLDFDRSIFGMLVEGESNRHNINDTTTNPIEQPTRTVTINTVEVFTDTENKLLKLKAPAGASGQTQITVHVNDGFGNTSSRTFNVTVVPDTHNAGPFLRPAYAVPTGVNTPTTFQVGAMDVEGDAVEYSATAVGNPAAQVQINSATGLVTVTPPSGFEGTLQVRVAVKAAAGVANDTLDPEDAQLIDVLVTSTPRPWLNSTNALDVDNDGLVIPLDALVIINELNRRTAQEAQIPLAVPAPTTRSFFDTNGDGFVSALDVLLVVNRLNAPQSAAGEASASLLASALPSDAAVYTDAAFGLLVAEADQQKKRRV